MRHLYLLTMATLTVVCGRTSALAQNPAPAPNATNANNPSMPANAALTGSQKATYDSWSVEQKAKYDKWPAEYQTYFWSLTAKQQAGWLALSDAQRKQVYEMTPENRAAAWSTIEQQMSGSVPPSASAAPAP